MKGHGKRNRGRGTVAAHAKKTDDTQWKSFGARK